MRPKKKKKRYGLGWTGKWEDSGSSWRKGNHIQNTLCGKKNPFSIKNNINIESLTYIIKIN